MKTKSIQGKPVLKLTDAGYQARVQVMTENGLSAVIISQDSKIIINL